MSDYPDEHEHCIPFGPINGAAGLAREVLLFLGYDSHEHPQIAQQLDRLLGEETLNIGREVLAEHGLPVLIDGEPL